jgi:hypothetical protein
LAIGCLLAQFVTGFELNAQVIARPVTLGWYASLDTTVRGYAIYFGATNQTAPARIDTGTNLSCTISNLVVGTTYRLYAVSYNAQGVESLPSNQVQFTPTQAAVPGGPRLQITRQSDGSMKLDCLVGVNKTCAIQFAATPTAKYWQTLTNVAANQAGNVIATDFSASRVPQRFYRVSLTPQPLLSAITIARQSNGAMRLSWLTPPKAVCRVQSASSPAATTWATLTTVTANDEGQAVWVDQSATSATSRFYRVAMP